MAPKSSQSPGKDGAEYGSSPTAENYAGMSVKKLTAALEEREAQFVDVTKAIRKLETETVQAESKAFRSEEEHHAALMEVDRQASHESVLASEAQRLATELRALSTHREEIEARKSYGSYQRWRQRLHQHLGCSPEEADKGVEWLLPRGNGSMPSSDAAKVIDEARQWKQKVEDMKTALASSEQKAFDLRRGRDNAELEWMRLGLDLSEQKQWASEWWQWHLSQMPEYHQQNQQIQNLEARSRELAAELDQDRQQLEELQADEGVAYQSVAEAQHKLAEGEELEMEISRQALEASEESAALRRKVVPGGIPGDEDGIPLVQTWKQRLLKATQEAEKLEREAHEAKQEERNLLSLAAQKEREIDDVEQRIKKVEKNADLLALRYKEQTRRLAERDREHLRLVKANRDVALDMERNRSILSSWGALRERRDSAGAGQLDHVELQQNSRSRTPSPQPSDSASQQRQPSPVVGSSSRHSSSGQRQVLNGNGAVDQTMAQNAHTSQSPEPRRRGSTSQSHGSHKPTTSSGETGHSIRNGTARSQERWIPAGPNAETARSHSASRSHDSPSVNGNGSLAKIKPNQVDIVGFGGNVVGSGDQQDSTEKFSHRLSRSGSPRPSGRKSASPRPSGPSLLSLVKDSGSPVLSGYESEKPASAPKPVPLRKRPL